MECEAYKKWNIDFSITYTEKDRFQALPTQKRIRSNLNKVKANRIYNKGVGVFKSMLFVLIKKKKKKSKAFGLV